MAKPIKMPKLSDQMTEGKIAEWLKHEGDEVQAGDVVAQVETEKATLDVEAFESGVLIGLVVGARGEKVPDAPAARGQPDAAKEQRSGGEVSHASTQAAPQAQAKVPVAPQRETPAARPSPTPGPTKARSARR
jgi:pyruvate dehydrogenase E2 component (dihydrolipoamide acetyltransferase)